MYCNKTLNGKINRVHKKALRAVTGDYEDSLDDLLSIERGLTIHSKNLHAVLIEIYKSISGSNHAIVRNMYELKFTPYDLRTSCLLSLPHTK